MIERDQFYTFSHSAGLSVSDLFKGNQSEIIAWILIISERKEELVSTQEFAECWEKNTDQCKRFTSASPVLRRHCNVLKKTVVLDRKPVDIGGKLFGNIVVLADRDREIKVPRVTWQPYNIDSIDDWKCLATITTLPSRRSEDLNSANVLDMLPIIYNGVTLGDLVVMKDTPKIYSFERNKREYPEVFLQPSDIHVYKKVKIYGNRGEFVYVERFLNGSISLSSSSGLYMKIKALDIIYQNKIDRQMPRGDEFVEPPWGWDECTFIKAVFASTIPDGVTPRDYHHALLKSLPFAHFSFDPVTIHCDNHTAISVKPGVFKGYIVLQDSFFGHEVEALDIIYKNEIYRLTPISKNTFQEPGCFWHNCVFVKAVLHAPKTNQKSCLLETHVGSVTPSGKLKYFQLDSYLKTVNENDGLEVTSWSTWCIKVLMLLSIIVIFIAIYAKLVYFTKSPPEIEVDDEVAVDDEVEGEHSWFSWFVDPPAPPPRPPRPPKPVKPISHLDSLSEIVDRIWKSFINAFPENDDFE